GNLVARSLFGDTDPNAAGGVTLLAWRAPVRLQDALNELGHRLDRRPRPLCRRSLLGHRGPDRLADQPSMHAKFARPPSDAGYAELVLTPYLFEQFHRCSSPAHRTSCRPSLVGRVGRARTAGGPFPNITLGHST